MVPNSCKLYHKKSSYVKTICIILCAVVVLSSCASSQSKEDVINKIWNGAGGKKTWQNSRFLTFVFAPQKEGKTLASRSHLWDRYTGDYRFETKTEENENLLVLFNVNTQKGISYLNGKTLPDSLNKKEIKNAYGYFINDSYWLLAPLKLEDEGVKVTLNQPEIIEGTSCEVLHLAFGNVGITPGDQYWLYVDSETGHIKRWKFLLEGTKEPGIFNWTNYKDLGGGLILATQKQTIDKSFAITFPIASVLIDVERNKFTKK
ncbi:MAG: hypothetical protein H7096_00555 [Flavobacterium sp.]|nr:hypothetical protein [Pedobacter sp.]